MFRGVTGWKVGTGGLRWTAGADVGSCFRRWIPGHFERWPLDAGA